MARIGRYVVDKEIGRGSMGVVYLAHDPRLNRKVAIKTYAPPPAMPEGLSRESRERFLREARAAAALSHPGIVTLFDVGEDEETGHLFFAMEWVPGRNLQRILQEQGPFEPHRVLAMASVLADALHVAHSAGIIHRDLKPANILIRESDGAVKLADFGVAHLLGSSLTKSNASVGSPAYMSPEQVLGRALDGRSDLFSLGVVLYEAFSGVRPFRAEESVALAHAIAYEEPDAISKCRWDLTPELEGFFQRALAKNPADRFEDGKRFHLALAKALPGVCETQRIEVVAATRPIESEPTLLPAALRRWAVGGIAVLVLLTGLLLRWNAGDAPASIPDPAPPRLEAGDAGASARQNPSTSRQEGSGAPHLVAYLEIDGRSLVPQGQLTLLVDRKEVYSRVLLRPKTKNLLQRMVHRTAETWGTRLDLPPGRHEIVVRIVPDGRTTGYQETITVVLKPGGSRSLHIVAGAVRREEISLSLD